MRAMALGLLLESILLAGCGEVHDPGGGPADADPGGGDADLSGTATVITQAALFGGTIGASVGNIDLVSSLPDSSVLATATTDASGRATIKVYPGGSVTAVYKHTVDLGADLITWAGVSPGETLTFGSRSFSTEGQGAGLGGQFYTWPPLEGATQFRVYTSCLDSGLSAVSPDSTSLFGLENASCHREPMDVMFAAFDAGGLMAVGALLNVRFQDRATVSLGAWNQAKTGEIRATGLPLEVTEVRGAFSPVLDGTTVVSRQIAGTPPGANPTPTGGAVSATFRWTGAGDRTVGALSLVRPDHASIEILDSFSSATVIQTVADPVLPPWGRGETAVNAERGTASWSLAPDAASVHDGQVLALSWSRTTGTTTQRSQWHIIVPPGQTSVTFPALPPALAAHRPAAQDSVSASTQVFEISSVTGYDMLRTRPSADVMCLACAVHAGDLQRVVSTSL